jgi:hypothetical protein
MKLRAVALALATTGAGLAVPLGVAHAAPIGMNDRLGSAQPDRTASPAAPAGGARTQHIMRAQEVTAGLTSLPVDGLG